MSAHLRRLDPEEVEELQETGDLWVACPGFPEYTASWSGQVKSWTDDRYPDGRLLLPYYRTNALTAEGSRRSKSVAQFVADAFLIPRPGPASHWSLLHVDGDNQNNAATNLEWESREALVARTIAIGHHPMVSKTHCLRGHLLSGENVRITKSGSRACIACSRASWSASRYRRRAQAAGKPYTHITTDWVIAQRTPKEGSA